MVRRLLIVAAALLVFAAAFLLRDSSRTGSSPAGSDLVVAEAQEDGRDPLPRLVDLGSDRCIPCKQMAPILEELKTEYAGVLSVEFIDVWKDPDAGEPYGVRVIPTQVFIDANGKERFRHEGFLSKQAILSQWAELGIELTAGSTIKEP